MPISRVLFLASCSISVAFLALGSVCSALSVSREVIELQTPAGQEGRAAIVISNESEAATTVSAYLRDVRISDEGLEENLDPGTLPRSCAEWISMSSSVIRLEAGESGILRLALRVPPEAHGSFWTRLYLEEPVSPAPPTHDDSIARGPDTSPATRDAPSIALPDHDPAPLRRRIPVRIFQEVPGTTVADASITEISAEVAAHDVPKVSMKIANSGNSILRCAARIELRDAEGAVAAKVPLGARGRFLVFPSGGHVVAVEAPTPLSPGTYTALAIVDYGGEHFVASEVVFDVPARRPSSPGEDATAGSSPPARSAPAPPAAERPEFDPIPSGAEPSDSR